MTESQASVARARPAPVSTIAFVLLGILIGGIVSWIYYSELLPSPTSRFTVVLYSILLQLFLGLPVTLCKLFKPRILWSNTLMTTASWVQFTASRSSGSGNLTMDILRNGLVCISGTSDYQVTGRCVTSLSGLIR